MRRGLQPLLDDLPQLAGLLDQAPPRLIQGMLDAFDIRCIWNKNDNQVTIRAVITDSAPQTITDPIAALTPATREPEAATSRNGEPAHSTRISDSPLLTGCTPTRHLQIERFAVSGPGTYGRRRSRRRNAWRSAARESMVAPQPPCAGALRRRHTVPGPAP